jgi:hypothetical protein
MNDAKKPTIFATFKAVAWSFLGIRKRKDFEQDQVTLKPYHLIAAGIIGVFILIGVLMVVAKVAVS